MKDFLKFTFASVIGVILAGVVFTILGIITPGWHSRLIGY